jgi:hypothetical protein
MPMDAEPVVGAMYENSDGRSFEVAGLDEDEATVQLRYPDGRAEEIDLDAWYEMDLEQIAAPSKGGEAADEEYDDEVKSQDAPDDEGEEEDEDDLDDEYEE